MEKQVIAIDFGTSNTYLTFGNTEELTTNPIMIHDERGISSAVLLTNNASFESDDLSDVYIGEEAISEYNSATKEERRNKNYRFFANFKPDIGKSDVAYNVSVIYLKKILRDAQSQNILLSPENYQVNVGVPSESNWEYKTRLREIMRKSGWGDILLIDEPIGALYDQINQRSFPMCKLMTGLLVIDFGGGTCDFAYMKNGRCDSSWGDMFLGGRLFDDLFYQWFLEQNPGVEKRIEENHFESYLRMVACREMKEKFSVWRNSHPKTEKPFSYAIPEYGSIQGGTWEEFIQRTKNYKPSSPFLKQCEEENVGLPPELRCQKIDLIQRFGKSLSKGLFEKHIQVKDIHAVILAGGSSRWSFVKECSMENLHISSEIILQSANPYDVISKGLAYYQATKFSSRKKWDDLKNSFPEFKASLLEKKIKPALELLWNDTQKKITVGLFDSQLKPIFEKYRQKSHGIDPLNGKRSISNLKRDWEDAVRIYQPRLEKEIYEIFSQGSRVLHTEVCDEFQRWLKDKRVILPEVEPSSIYYAEAFSPENLIATLTRNLTGNLFRLFKKTESWSLPRSLFCLFVSESKLMKCKKNFQAELQKILSVENGKISDRIVHELNLAIDEQLACLSELMTQE